MKEQMVGKAQIAGFDKNESTDVINRAFTKQAPHYDAQELSNPVLKDWRGKIYAHVENYLKPQADILEINAGTGIDAVYFAGKGHNVHATDLSDGMAEQIKQKIDRLDLRQNLRFSQCPFGELGQLQSHVYDYLFSNFGGLNCTENLGDVCRLFPKLLKEGGIVTLVIMPKVCPWEWAWALKGQWRKAFRRLDKNGALAQLEGEHFRTHYFGLAAIKRAMGTDFALMQAQSLGVLAPPPASTKFIGNHPYLYKFLNRLDGMLGRLYPLNRWGDHIILTFKYLP